MMKDMIQLQNYTYKHLYFLHISISDKPVRNKAFKTGLKAVELYYNEIVEQIRSELELKGIKLISNCFEAPDKKVSHPHFHFLLNTDIYNFNEISNIIYSIFGHVKSRLVNNSILENNYDFFIKYKGNGQPYKDYSSSKYCPTEISGTCPFKLHCFNEKKLKSCCNYIVYINRHSNHLENVYKYIKRDKVSGGDKKYLTIYKPLI